MSGGTCFRRHAPRQNPGSLVGSSLVRARRTPLHMSDIGPALLGRFPGMSGVPIGAGLELSGDGDAHVFVVGS